MQQSEEEGGDQVGSPDRLPCQVLEKAEAARPADELPDKPDAAKVQPSPMEKAPASNLPPTKVPGTGTYILHLEC